MLETALPYVNWDDISPSSREFIRRAARAAIAAMREPTLAMANAPYRSELVQALKTDPPPYALAYQIMIDAALKD